MRPRVRDALARSRERIRGIGEANRVPRVRTEVYTSLSSRSSTVSRRFVPFSRSDFSWLAAAAALSALLAPRREGRSMTEERDSPRSFAPIRAFVRERVRSHRSRLVRIGRSHLEKYLKIAGVVSRRPLPEISLLRTITRCAHVSVWFHFLSADAHHHSGQRDDVRVVPERLWARASHRPSPRARHEMRSPRVPGRSSPLEIRAARDARPRGIWG